MTSPRISLLKSGDHVFLTDGGLETTLIFHEGYDLPYFAAFDLIRSREGKATLRKYFERYLAIARKNNTGFILESPTWRASANWGKQLGYSDEALHVANLECIELLEKIRNHHETETTPILISGSIGPWGDGYIANTAMISDEAEAYHEVQINSLVSTGIDFVTALTMTSCAEAVGVVRAAKAAGIPVVISFTVETDGRLPSGEPLKEAIEKTDAETGDVPIYYMINCAHPSHFDDVLSTDEAWTRRLGGIRANASKCSHAELDEATELDDGDPAELGREYSRIKSRQPQMRVFGGCCGTDHRHIESIGNSVAHRTVEAA